MNVIINKKTELAAVIFNISNYKKLYPHLNETINGTKDYKNKIEMWFKDFENEETIRLFNLLVEELEFAYDAPIELFLNLNDDFTYDDKVIFNENSVVSEFVIENIDKSLMKKFLDTLPEFVEKTSFIKYYNSNDQLYQKFIESGKKPIEEYNIVKMLSNFIKDEKFYENITINLLPFTTGNFGLTIGGNSYPNYGIDYENESVVFGTKYPSLVIHELLHSKINKITNSFSSQIELFNFNDEMEKLSRYAHVNSNKSIINEYIVRASEKIITKDIYEEEKYKKRIQIEKDGGFTHIEWVIEKIKKMNQNSKIDCYLDSFINDFLEYTNEKHINNSAKFK